MSRDVPDMMIFGGRTRATGAFVNDKTVKMNIWDYLDLGQSPVADIVIFAVFPPLGSSTSRKS